MDIAALSIGLSQMKVAQQVSISVMKMAMNVGQTQINDMVQMIEQNTKMMEQSINSHLGVNIDIKL